MVPFCYVIANVCCFSFIFYAKERDQADDGKHLCWPPKHSQPLAATFLETSFHSKIDRIVLTFIFIMSSHNHRHVQGCRPRRTKDRDSDGASISHSECGCTSFQVTMHHYTYSCIYTTDLGSYSRTSFDY